jgi:hypothetical protein
MISTGTTLPFCSVMWYNISIFLGKSHSRVKRTCLTLVLYKEKLGYSVMIMIEWLMVICAAVHIKHRILKLVQYSPFSFLAKDMIMKLTKTMVFQSFTQHSTHH